MAHYDLIGLPFPKEAPIFASDRPLQTKIFQLESFIEIQWDLRDINLYIQQAKLIEASDINSIVPGIGVSAVLESLAVAAILMYAKFFRSATGRTVLNSDDIFSLPLSQFHGFVMDCRDKFIAHQEWKANSHCLHFHQSSDGRPPRLNSSGHTTRIPIYLNFNWGAFSNCAEAIEEFISNKIAGLSSNIEMNFTNEQIEFLDSVPTETSQPPIVREAFQSRRKP